MARSTSFPDLVIWDFDGTIADTHAVIIDSFRVVFELRDLGRFDAAAAKAVIGIPLGAAFGRIIGSDNERVLGGLVADYREVFAELAPTSATMFDGMAGVLDTCAQAGLESAIATSRGRASLDDLLDAFGIADRFVAITTAEDVTAAKPAPEMVLRTAALTGVAPEKSLVIGDTTFDIEMGRSAGAPTLGVTWGNQSADVLRTAQPDRIVDTVTELARAIGIECF